MSFYVLAGRYLNHLSLAPAAPTPNPAADASFPVGYTYDRRANVPFRWGSSATSHNLKVDLEFLTDPSFEVGVSSWTAGDGGTVTQSNTVANTGTYSLKITDTSSAYAARSITARAGQTLKVSWALYGGGGAVAASIQVYNRTTGKFLQTNGTWAVTGQSLDSQTTAAWKTGSQTFTVEDSTVTFTETVTLQVALLLSASGTVYFDDISLLPAVTWSSVHGHNITPQTGVKLQSSPDDSVWTDRITFTLRRDSFYGTVAAQYVRYWRILLTSISSVQPYIGEWVLGQSESFNVNPLYPATIEHDEQQERTSTPQGSQGVALYGGTPQRRLSMAFAFRTDADHQQWEKLHWLARGGAWPMVIAPTEMDSRVVILGRLDETIAFTKSDYWSRGSEVVLLEEPLPSMG